MKQAEKFQTKIKNLQEMSQINVLEFSQYSLKLPPLFNPYQYQNLNNRFLTIYPAYDETFILEQANQASFKHINRNGKLIKYAHFKNIIGDIHMMKEDKAIVWEYSISGMIQKQQYQIVQWDLLMDEEIRIIYKVNSININQTTLRFFVFSQSKLMCVVQHNFISQQLWLSFYKFPILSKNNKPTFLFKESIKIDSRFNINKVNNDSAFLWSSNLETKTGCFQFYMFNMRWEDKKFKKLTFEHKIQHKQGLFLKLMDIWEVNPGKIYLKIVKKTQIANFQQKYKALSKTERQQKSQQLLKQQTAHEVIWDYIQNTFYELKLPQVVKICPIQSFALQFLHCLRDIKKFEVYQNRYDKLVSFGQQQFQYNHNYYAKDIYYIDFESKEVIAVEQADNYSFRSKKTYKTIGHCSPDFNRNLLIDYHIKIKSSQTEIAIREVRVNPIRYQLETRIAFLVLEYIGNICDEELIRQVVQLNRDQSLTIGQK